MNKISYKVMKADEWADGIWFRIACSEGDPNHDLSMEVEWDKDVRMVFINFYKKLAWSAYWGSNNWFSAQWCKLRAIYRIIFWGWTEVEETFILDEPEQIENFIAALNEGRSALLKKYADASTDKI